MHGFSRWVLHTTEGGTRWVDELGPLWRVDARACLEHALYLGLTPAWLVELPDDQPMHPEEGTAKAATAGERTGGAVPLWA